MATLVGDRFVRVAAGWLDVASGAPVDVRVGPKPEDAATRQRRCAALYGILPFDGAQLVDFGPHGADGWFEARRAGDATGGDGFASPPFSLKRLPRAATTEIARIAADPELRGVQHVRFVAPPLSGGDVALSDAARALRGLGFVTVRADVTLPRELRLHLCHRHVVVLLLSESAQAAGAEWAARLAAASDRGHLLIERVVDDCAASDTGGAVVRLEPCDRGALAAAYVPGRDSLDPRVVSDAANASGGWPGRFARELAQRHAAATGAGQARERAVVSLTTEPGVTGTWPFSVSLPKGASPSETRLFTRAARCHRLGRAEAGDRWLSAGLEASRRRGDAAGVLRALEDWTPRLIAAGRWSRAIALTTRALNDAVDPAIRASVARLCAAANLEAGRVTRAGACVDTAIAIEQLTRRRITDEAIVLRAAVRLWQGRWREGRAEIEALPIDRLQTRPIALWRELLAWADGDTRRRRWMPDGRGEGREDVWATAVRLFRAAASGTAPELRALTEAIGEPQGELRMRWQAVLAAQAWLDIGDEDAATRAIARCGVRAASSRGLVDVAAASIRRGLCRAKSDELEWLETMASRERLRGLARWGQRRSDMQMLQDVSQLLEIVQSCEDEAVGLRQVCAWIQTSAGATACAIASAPGGEVLAGETLAPMGVERGDVIAWLDHPVAALADSRAGALARAPIRYGGCVVGLLVGAAPPARARPLFESVQAAAVVCGAMVRARLDAIAAAGRGDALSRDIIGSSPAIEAVRAMAGRAAQAPFPVVIEGESGTGKELVARALHKLGPRRDRVFAALNCAALSDDLVEAELFSHARGAFTHAVNARAGLFEDAHQGTLFLDEVGELSPRAQAKLLRVLQEGEIRRVGENESRPVDVRVIAATNRPLAALAAAGRFRDDLMFRLSVVRIQVPPLRDRAGDVPLLALAFWRHAARRVGTRAVLGPDAVAALAQLSWPGNVRELQNAMAAIAVAAPGTGRVSARLVRLVLKDLHADMTLTDAPIVPLETARRDVERRLVSAALAKHTGSRVAAANALGISRQGLSKAMRRLGLAEAGVA